MKELISLLEGNTFVVSDRRGDIEPSLEYPTGLFSFDTRFLSTWILTLDGERLHALSVDEETSYETTYFLVPGEPSHYVDTQISVLRQRAINGSFEETLTVLNHTTKAVDLALRMEIGSDFADLFEIKNAQRKPAGATARWRTALWCSTTAARSSTGRSASPAASRRASTSRG